MSDFDFGEVTEENLHTKLNEYHRALRTEFEVKSKSAPDNVEEYATDFFKKNLAAAMAQIVYLSTHADSESVRMRASQFIIDQAFSDSRQDGDPIRDLLKKLTKEPVGYGDAKS